MSLPRVKTISNGDDLIGFKNIRGDIKGGIGTLGTENLEIIGTTDGATKNVPIRVSGSQFLVNSDGIHVAYQGSNQGDLVTLGLPITDPDTGVSYFSYNTFPYELTLYSEAFSASTDHALDTNWVEIIDVTLANGYSANTSKASFVFQVANLSNKGSVIEYTVIKDDDLSSPEVFTADIPPRIGVDIPSYTNVSGGDTITTELLANDTLQIYVREVGTEGILTVVGSKENTLLQIEQGNSQALLQAVQDLVGSQNETEPSVADEVLIFDQSDNYNPKVTTLRDIISLAYIDSFISGTDNSGITTTATPTALSVFNNATTFYSSTPILIKTVGDTGFTTLAPVRYEVTCSVTVRTAGTTDFFAQVYAGGLPCGEVQDISGDGNSKAVYAGITAFTHLLNIGDAIELRVWDGGETINSIIATMKIRYAGAD